MSISPDLQDLISQCNPLRCLPNLSLHLHASPFTYPLNNAAHQEPYSSILDADPDVYWKTWEVNVHGLFNMTRALLPMLITTRAKHDGLGIMINAASSGALSVRKGGASHRTSKLAVLRWTEALNLELGGDGLLAFCVNSGANQDPPDDQRARGGAIYAANVFRDESHCHSCWASNVRAVLFGGPTDQTGNR